MEFIQTLELTGKDITGEPAYQSIRALVTIQSTTQGHAELEKILRIDGCDTTRQEDCWTRRIVDWAFENQPTLYDLASESLKEGAFLR